ncbi:MAG: hypothetical protein GY938_02430 [Ketobacter sp.]|nr:hypothetical protein [Ketobacter sp.]
MVVPVSGLYVMEGHPLAKGKGGPFKGRLKFIGVRNSTRNICEYIGNPKQPNGFKEPRDIEDGPLEQVMVPEILQEYGFEGFLENPAAWVNDWVVKARSFEFECDD